MEKHPIKLDKIDNKIIRELERNSRASFTEIGKKVRLSGESVDYRIRRLKRAGAIVRLFAEANRAMLGLKTYRLYLKTNLPPEIEKKFINEFSNHPSVQWFAVCDGPWDYIIRYTLENEEQFKDDIERIMVKYGEYIREKNITITMYQGYQSLSYLHGGERKLRLDRERTRKVELDKKDYQILYWLYENSRMRTVDIAAKTGLSPDAVQYRIKKMVKNRTISYFTTWFDRRLFGYSYYKVFLWLENIGKEREKELLSYCGEHPAVVYINSTLGSWDLEIDFDAKGSEELHGMVKILRNKFSDVIREHSSVNILKDYLPNPFKKYIS